MSDTGNTQTPVWSKHLQKQQQHISRELSRPGIDLKVSKSGRTSWDLNYNDYLVFLLFGNKQFYFSLLLPSVEVQIWGMVNSVRAFLSCHNKNDHRCTGLKYIYFHSVWEAGVLKSRPLLLRSPSHGSKEEENFFLDFTHFW